MRRTISRRKFLKNATVFAGAALLGGPLFDNRAFAVVKPMKIGVLPPSHCALSMVHAHLSGNFKKNGVNAEIVYVSDMKEIIHGLVSGEFQAGQIISSSFFAMNAGIGPFAGKAVPLVTAQIGGTNGGAVVVRSDSAIRGPKDLAGKKIGIHNALTVQHLIVRTLLKKYNVDPDKGIQTTIIPMGEMIAALQKGEIDCFINAEPLASISKAKGIGKDMMLTAKIWFKHPCCAVTMKRDFFDNNRELAKSFYLSTLKSGLELNHNTTRQEALEKIHAESAPYNKLPLTALKSAFSPDRSDFDPFPYQSAGKALLGMMNESGALPNSVDIGKMVSQTFLSDFSRELHGALGQDAPIKNNREEKIASILT